jgi:hypothetical protein
MKEVPQVKGPYGTPPISDIKSACSKSQVFSTEAYASEVRFFKTL